MLVIDKKALQLNSRFCLPPNSLGYCGKNSAQEKFKSCVIEDQCESIQEELRHFIVLYPYLRTLSVISKKSKFSYDVAEGYWIGNDIQKNAENSYYPVLLDYFKKQGVPERLVKDLQKSKPKKFIPTHLFQVLHVGVGRASGSVPYNLESINNCMIRWGKVVEVKKKTAAIRLNSLKKNKGAKISYALFKHKEEFPYISGFVNGLKTGDVVAVHWKQIVKILSPDEVEKITFWTKKVLESIN